MAVFYTYETKCRRCGTFHEWNFAKKEGLEREMFWDLISNVISMPPTKPCIVCDKATVQDVVSYSDSEVGNRASDEPDYPYGRE